MTKNGEQLGWGPGYPHGVPASQLGWAVATRSGARWLIRKELVPIAEFIINEVERLGYLYDFGPTDPTDDWGYSNRPIAGTSIPSEHSRGIALDCDARKYPQGQTKIHPPQWVMDIWAKYGFENGVHWSNPDPMHYQAAITPNDAAFLVSSLAAHHVDNTQPPLPPSVPPVPPTQPPTILEEDEDMIRYFQLVNGPDAGSNNPAADLPKGAVVMVTASTWAWLTPDDWTVEQEINGATPAMLVPIDQPKMRSMQRTRLNANAF